MTASSRLAKTAALVLAIAVHGALALALAAPETPKLEGTQDAGELRLGNAFADMAAGTLTAEQAEETPRETTESIAPQPAGQTEPAEPIEPERTKVVKPRTPTETANATKPDTVMPLPAQDAAPVAPALVAAPKSQSVPLEQIAPPPPLEALEQSQPDNTAVKRSLRPQLRNPEFAAKIKTRNTSKQAKETPVKTDTRSAKGNSAQNAHAGVATGKATATARQSGENGQTKGTGNAAASSYPGLVMRKLSRAGKPRVNARGAAVVSFTIGDNGNLSALSLSRASGSSALDGAALQLVQSASPFPKPPEGARRSFSIQIKGQ